VQENSVSVQIGLITRVETLEKKLRELQSEVANLKSQGTHESYRACVVTVSVNVHSGTMLFL